MCKASEALKPEAMSHVAKNVMINGIMLNLRYYKEYELRVAVFEETREVRKIND